MRLVIEMGRVVTPALVVLGVEGSAVDPVGWGFNVSKLHTYIGMQIRTPI